MVTAKVAKISLGDNQHTKGSANLPTQIQAAELLNVSERSIRTAKKVQTNAAPELQQAVQQG